MPKILKIIDSCRGCPHYGYYSGGQHQCGLVNETVADKAVIAPFCPLTEFPSRVIADMGETIRLLREQYRYGLVLAVLSHIATKLKADVSARGVLTIKLKDKTSVYLRHDAIMEVRPLENTVIFAGDKGKYKLHPDACPPLLEKQFVMEGAGVKEELWQRLDIAT